MKIKISPSILSAFPAIHYTVIVVHNIDNKRKISNLSQLLRGTAVVAKNELKKIEKKDLFSRITELSLDDGSTFLESYLLGSRVKKILNGKDVEGKNNLINLVSLVSLKYFLPIHGVDLDQAETDYLLDLYQPKKGKKTPELDFQPETSQIALWFPNLGNWSEEDLDRFINEINSLLSKYFQAQIAEVFHLDSVNPEADLGYRSELEIAFQEKKAQELLLNPIPAPTISESPAITPITSAAAEAQQLSQRPADQLKQLLIDILQTNFPELSSLESAQDLELLVSIELPKDPSHGDLASNLAMKLSKSLNQSPQEVAAKLLPLIEAKRSELPVLASVEIVSPGFINFRLSSGYFENCLQQIIAKQEKYGEQQLGQGKKIMIEFGSLNMAKPFGAHHFLTTVIGQTLVNLYRKLGYQVLAADHPGDWGTQFGKTIYAYKHWGNKEAILQDPMNEFLKLYVHFHEESEKDPTLDEAARAEFRKLEQGDRENLDLWKWIIEISLQDLDKIYQTMGVKHDRRYGEAKYNQSCQELLQHGKELGVFVEGEKGAFIANLEAENLPPALVQKGDGTSLYLTRDLASIEERLKSEEGLQEIVYVVDSAQTLHFRQLFAVAQKLHLADPNYPLCQFKHVPYGRMNFADGAMSTRKGNVILGLDLIKEALRRSERILTEKSAGAEEQLPENEIKQLIQGMAIGSIKYAILMQSPESDFVFDWDKVLSFEGNSAPYLQYTYARTRSLLGKAAKASPEAGQDQATLFPVDQETSPEEASLNPFALPAEQHLLRLLPLFPDKVSLAALSFKPNTLTNYLHELAQAFNSFYGSVQVLKTQRADLLKARLDLVKATSQVIRNGLQILGITAFERM